MEDDDGTCLFDVLCDPQALNDFLHGTNELQTEDLLISSSSGEPSLFTDAPSPVSLLGDDRDSADTPPPGCVDLSFLEEALLSSPDGGDNPQVVQGGPMEQGGEGEEGEAAAGGQEEEEEEEEEVACDILQQSLQEADITEQTMALEAGLTQPGDGLALYSPGPLLSPPNMPFLPKSTTLPVTPALPRDTQAAVEPPQPSLLAVGPGCPSLKPTAPPQLMGLLPGNVFPAPSPETTFSLCPAAQGSSMIIHKAVSSMTARPFITPTLRAATAAPSILFQRAPHPIQPKLPISIQPRLVQISPKPFGQKPSPGLTFVPGTGSPNILLSSTPGPKAPPPQTSQQIPKPVSLQLVNQGGSFVLRPQGLFQGQNQFLLPGQSPMTITQSAGAQRPLLATPNHQGTPVHTMTPSTGQLMEGSQILTVPHRQINFSPVFTTPTGQLALRQATVLSGPLQLQSAPTVFQMPAQLAGTYTSGGQGGHRATLVQGPALGNHITLINSSGVLSPDMTSISIVNGTSVVQGLPFATQAHTEGQLSLQQASVVLLPDRAIAEERSISEETFHQLPQPYGHVLQHVSVQPKATGGLQSPSPPLVAVLQAQPAPDAPLVPDPAVELPKLLMPPADMTQVVEEVTHSLTQNQTFMQHLQQQALTPSELLVGAVPVVPMESLTSPAANEREHLPQSHSNIGQADTLTVITDQCVEGSPLASDPALGCSSSPTPVQSRTMSTVPDGFSPSNGITVPASESENAVLVPQTQNQVQSQVQHQQVQVPQALVGHIQVPRPLLPHVPQTPVSQPQDQAHVVSQGHHPNQVPQFSKPQGQPQIQTLHQFQIPQTAVSLVQASIPHIQVPQASVPQVQASAAQLQLHPQGQVKHPVQVPQTSASHIPVSFFSGPQTQAQVPVVYSSPSPLPVSVMVPQQQPEPLSLSASLSNGGQDPAVQQHTQSKPTAALAIEGRAFTLDIHPPSPTPQPTQADIQVPREQAQGPPIPTTTQHTGIKLLGPVVQEAKEKFTPAMRRHRFQQQLCLDHRAVQNPSTCSPFSTLDDAVRRLLPYHTCAGHLPTKEDFSLVDQEFDTVSGFLLKRTKDMVNKYRQLFIGEAQQESPSAEMVMLERLFLQAERFALGEDRRRARRDPELFMMALAPSSVSSPHASAASSSCTYSSGSPSSPPAWTRVSDRPPGLKTYRSSSRGALRLTIKQESGGSRKVVHNSACDPSGHKRDHAGQLTNGSGGEAINERTSSQAGNGAPPCPQHSEEISNGILLSAKATVKVLPCDRTVEAPITVLSYKTTPPIPISMPEAQVVCFDLPLSRDVSAPRLKRYKADSRCSSPSAPQPPVQEDNMLSEHLQSAIDSILELQRLQGPNVATQTPPMGPVVGGPHTGPGCHQHLGGASVR